jgi:hypothetical protein
MASVVIAGNTSGTVTLSAPDIAGSTTLTLPTTSGTIVTTAGGSTVPFALGSAASPSITFTGDTNTGIFSPGADSIGFAEGGAEVARFDSSGNFGIGTSSPGTRLQIGNLSDSNQALRFDFSDSSTARINSTRVGAGNLQSLLLAGQDTMQFQTSGSERMRIDSSGRLFVGTTVALQSSEKMAVLDTSGNNALFLKQEGGSGGWCQKVWNNATSGNNNLIEFLTESSITVRGSITYNRAGGTVAYNTTSDSRLKDNIESAPSAISKINSVQIRSYDWKETGNHVDFGVIAQELIQVAPEAVTEGIDNEDGTIKSPWAVDTAALVPAMIKAIQEQQAIINEQASTIAAFEARLVALENK